MGTLRQFTGVRDNFHLNFFCRWLCVFTRSESVVTKMLLNAIMSPTNAADLANKMNSGATYDGVKIIEFNFMLLGASGPA